MIRVGVTFPQTELGGDPGAIRAYAERVEELATALSASAGTPSNTKHSGSPSPRAARTWNRGTPTPGVEFTRQVIDGRMGYIGTVRDDVESVTRRPSVSLRQWASQNRDRLTVGTTP